MTTRADFATPETASLELAEVRRFGWARAAFAFLLTLVAVAVLVVAFVFGLAKAFEGKAMAGVAVAGVSVAGLDRAAAEARLREALPPLSQGKVTLSLEGRPTTIDYASIGRDYELGVMVDRAFTVGRTGNLLSQVSEGLRALVRGAAVEPVVRYDVAAVQRQVTAAAASVARAPVDASTRLAARSGTFVVSPSTDGSGVDEALAQVQVAQIISSTDAGNASISLTGRPIEPAVTTAEATAAAHQARAMTGGGLVLTVDNETFTVKTPTLQKWLAFGPTPDGGYRARVVPGRIQQTLETLVGEIDQAPRNARFRFSDTRVVGVIPAANGRQIDIARSTAKITEAMSARSGTRRVALAITTAEPALTTAEAQAGVPRMHRISRWTGY